jgi:hypothetical protein
MSDVLADDCHGARTRLNRGAGEVKETGRWAVESFLAQRARHDQRSLRSMRRADDAVCNVFGGSGMRGGYPRRAVRGWCSMAGKEKQARCRQDAVRVWISDQGDRGRRTPAVF